MLNIKILLFSFFVLINTNCERDSDQKSDQDCYSGKIVWKSCGGTVVQILNTTNIGESWTNSFTTPIKNYENCILIGNFPSSKSSLDSIYYFEYNIVEKFSSGNYCDIGGLPSTKSEITKFFNLKCPD